MPVLPTISAFIPRQNRHPRLPALVLRSSRCYATQIPQPMRDMMTGEIIQLPDIDVSYAPIPHFTEGAQLTRSQPSLLKIEKTTSPKTRLAPSKLVFGRTFTDHMLVIPWSSTAGWGTPNIKPCESSPRQLVHSRLTMMRQTDHSLWTRLVVSCIMLLHCPFRKTVGPGARNELMTDQVRRDEGSSTGRWYRSIV